MCKRASLGPRVNAPRPQWLGWSEPDPDGVQHRILPTLLRKLLAGEAGDVEADFLSFVLGDKTKVGLLDLT